MKRTLRVSPEAEAELQSAATWYERQRRGLGVEFVAVVDRAATSTDIHKTHIRNCDAPAIKRDIALPCSPKSLGRAECARHRAMPQPLRSRRSYGHRIREIVCRTGNPRIFRHLRIPRSPTASWLSRGCRSVVSLDWNHDMACVLDEGDRLSTARRQTRRARIDEDSCRLEPIEDPFGSKVLPMSSE